MIDYDPMVIEVRRRRYPHKFYVMQLTLFLDEFNVARTKSVVSTVTDYATNLTLLRYIRDANDQTSFICHANNLMKPKNYKLAPVMLRCHTTLAQSE